MNTKIALLAALALSVLLAGCADGPLEDQIEVGYRSGAPANSAQVEVAAAEPSVQPQRA